MDALDGFCHEFESCAESLKIDGCDTETQEFSPTVLPGADFTCENLKNDPCQERFTKTLAIKNIFRNTLENEF